MNKIVFLFLFSIFLLQNATAQKHPWEEFGYKPRVKTLSNGKYEEFHDQDTIVKIGSAIFDRYNGKLLGKVQNDTLYMKPYVVSRWISPDPLTEEFPDWNPYNYVKNNPILRIDPDGRLDDIYVFDESGNYSYKIKQEGEHVGRVEGENGFDFKFVDPENDPKDIEKGYITKIKVAGDEEISSRLDDSGVNEKENQDNKFIYALKEGSVKGAIIAEDVFGDDSGSSQMDYFKKSSYNGEKIDFNTLYVTKTKSGTYAHNDFNYGNFLWGAGMKTLGFSKLTARIGAHVNSVMTGDGLDSKDDQKSIKIGIEWEKEH